MVYDSYKHYSKYPFDNYRINILQWGGHISVVLTREPGKPFTPSSQLQLLNQWRFTTKFTK